MQTISGLNHYQKMIHYIKDTIQQANEHPFEQYLWIVDNQKSVEKIFLQYTHYLVNIRILTWNQFMQETILSYHMNKHHIVEQTHLVYILQHILKNHSFQCFSCENPYPLIQKIIPILKDIDLYSMNYQTNENIKLKELMSIYQLTKEALGTYAHFTKEDIIQELSFKQEYQHIYIEADHLYQPLRQKIIKHLDQASPCTLLYTYENNSDDDLYPQLLKSRFSSLDENELLKQLFKEKITPSDDNLPLYTFVSPTPLQEVQRAIYHIYQTVVDQQLHYKDFMIIYPDTTYQQLILNTLQQLQIPHHIPVITSCQYDYDYQQVLHICKQYPIQKVSEFAKALLKEELNSEYTSYFQSLLAYEDHMTPQEFIDFFQTTYTNHHRDISRNDDYIHVCPIDDCLCDNKKHLYFLGMNETVLPRVFKDTELILNEDIDFLQSQHLNAPLTTSLKLSIHKKDILKALSQPYLSMTFSYVTSSLSGNNALPSSLYQQLSTLYQLKPLPVNTFLPLVDFYQLGGQTKDKQEINSMIHTYIQTRNQPSLIDTQMISNLYSQTLSVSQIETYNKCPFLYFIQYGLQIYPTQEKKLLPNELGSLVHYILSENIHKDKDIRFIVEKYVSQNEKLLQKIQDSPVNQYFIEQLIKDMDITLNVVNEFLDASQFTIHSKEEKVLGKIDHLQFKGFVDRIDMYQDYVSIIDYKSSAKDIDLTLARQGFNIQMLLYLQFVIEKYQKDPGAVLYFNTKKRILTQKQKLSLPINKKDFISMYKYGGYVIGDNDDIIYALDSHFDRKSSIINVTYVKSKDTYTGHILSNEGLQELFQDIEEHILSLYEMMSQGHIDITPKGSDNPAIHMKVNPCPYCSYKSICHFDYFYNEYKLVQLDEPDENGGDNDAI